MPKLSRAAAPVSLHHCCLTGGVVKTGRRASLALPRPPRVHMVARAWAVPRSIYDAPRRTRRLTLFRRRRSSLSSPLFRRLQFIPMAERFPGDGAAGNDFGRRHLHEDEARLLYEAEYRVPPDMRVPGAWRISAGDVLVPPIPTGAAQRAEIARIRSNLPRAAREGPRYVPDSPLWEPYFRRRHAQQLEATNGDAAVAAAAPGPSNPPRQPGEGCSRDGGGVGGDDDDGGGGGGDYTRFYSLLGM